MGISDEQINNLLDKEEIEALLNPQAYLYSPSNPQLENCPSFMDAIQEIFYGLELSYNYSSHPLRSENYFITKIGDTFFSFSANLCQMLLDVTLGGETLNFNSSAKLGTIGEKIINNFATKISTIMSDEALKNTIQINFHHGDLIISHSLNGQQAISAYIDDIHIIDSNLTSGKIIPLNIQSDTEVSLFLDNTKAGCGVMGRHDDKIAIKITSTLNNEN